MARPPVFRKCEICGEEKLSNQFHDHMIRENHRFYKPDRPIRCKECCKALRSEKDPGKRGPIRGTPRTTPPKRQKLKDHQVYDVRKGIWIDPSNPALKNFQ